MKYTDIWAGTVVIAYESRSDRRIVSKLIAETLASWPLIRVLGQLTSIHLPTPQWCQVRSRRIPQFPHVSSSQLSDFPELGLIKSEYSPYDIWRFVENVFYYDQTTASCDGLVNERSASFSA